MQYETQTSYLFTVRLWAEDMGDGVTEYRGLVRHVLSSASWHFRQWDELLAFMVSTMEHHEGSVH